MNSVILLHDKYPKNSPNKNDKNKDNIDLNFNKDKFNESFENDKKDDNTKINNSFQITNLPHNIFDLSYIKNKNLFNISGSKHNIENYFHSHKKASKRSYYEAFYKDKYEKSENDKNKDNVVNLNINNNNYFYINNKIYNTNNDEEYNIHFSKSKRFKDY